MVIDSNVARLAFVILVLAFVTWLAFYSAGIAAATLLVAFVGTAVILSYPFVFNAEVDAE